MNLYHYYIQVLSTPSTTVTLTLMVSVCLLGASQLSEASQWDLYKESDDVIRLNSTSFKPTVFQQNKNITYIVQFYNTYCGHCQMFAPIYKELGNRVKNWTSVIRLACIDCSQDENVGTCSENKVEGYPTIYVYPPNAKLDEPNDKPLNLRSILKEWTIDDIEDTMVDIVTNLTKSKREYPLVVNALQPITLNDPRDLKRVYPLEHNKQLSDDFGEPQTKQDVMFIVESERSYLGKKLILEYYRISNKLELRRILLSNRKLLKAMLSSEDYAKLNDQQPLLIKINGLSSEKNAFHNAQVIVKGEKAHILPTSPEHERSDFIYDRFKAFFNHYYSIELDNENINNPKVSLKDPESNHIPQDIDQLDVQHMLQSDPSTRRKIFAMDLLKGIVYMITHEIKIKGDLSPIEFNIVRNMLTVLKKYLPLEKWDSSVYKFIVDLRTRLDDNRSNFEKNGIKAHEMSDLLDLSGGEAVRLTYGRENWVSCLESDRQHKGYTCSLWLLFHTLTVGEYKKAPPARTRPTMVLISMRDYITKFLGCTVCASNFQSETEHLESKLVSRNSSVLWLWATHNRVNQRLNNEKAQENRKLLIDVVFPKHDLCSQCIKTDISEVGVDGKTLDDIEWNLEGVFHFLLETYKPDKVVTPIEMAAMITKLKKKFNYDFLASGKSDIKDFDASRRVISNSGGIDMNKSIEQWNLQSLFSTSDMNLCLILYLASILMVVIVCVSLKPRWKRFKTK